MIYVVATLMVKPETRAEFIAAATACIKETRKEKGNIAYDLHADRIAVNGPDITVSARAAQSLSLLFFELASHSDEGLSLVGKHPNIVAHWEISGEESESVFHFRWEEFNTSQATRRPDSDFGLILLDRVAPEALGGTAKRYFTDVSYVYELIAPMETVVDMNWLSRMIASTAARLLAMPTIQ